MLDIAYQRKKPRHNPDLLHVKIGPDKIVKDSESGLFFVNSESTDQSYLVDPVLKLCSCPIGSQGTFCKHVLAVAVHHPVDMKLECVATNEDRYNLAQIAYGPNEAPSREFFGLSNLQVDNNINNFGMELSVFPTAERAESTPDDPSMSEDLNAEINSTLDLFKKIIKSHSTSDSVLSGLKSMKKTLLKLQTVNSNTFAISMHNFGKESLGSLQCKRIGKTIKVQPTSLSRRTEGQTRGGGALWKGRPRKVNSISNKLLKKSRAHALHKNVLLALPNAKIH